MWAVSDMQWRCGAGPDLPCIVVIPIEDSRNPDSAWSNISAARDRDLHVQK